MKYISHLISRTTGTSSSSPFSPFHRRSKASKREPRSTTGGEQSTGGPRDGSDLQLSDLLGPGFRNVHTPLAETNAECAPVVDDSVCYDRDCRICIPTHECAALLRISQREFRDGDVSFGFPFQRPASTRLELSDEDEGDDDSGSSDAELRPDAAAKKGPKARFKARSVARRWSKVRNQLAHFFPL